MTATPEDAMRLSMMIRPLLAGRAPEVQGAVLGELVSLFIAGHHPDLRDAMLDEHIKLVRGLVPESEKESTKARMEPTPSLSAPILFSRRLRHRLLLRWISEQRGERQWRG
jgi:hypothetical protein